jgi:hypothetical protein
MTKQEQINAWRIAQGLEPLSGSGKTAKARANGTLRQQASNAAARAQANRDIKARRSTNRGK